MTGTEDHWEVLERIGAGAAGDLSGEEARQAKWLVLKNAEGRRLIDSHARLLALLRTVGEEASEALEAAIDRAVQRATEVVREPHESGVS